MSIYAAQAEGIAESTFHSWKADGEIIAKRVTDKDGETIEKELKKLTVMQKLKLEFLESIGGSIAERILDKDGEIIEKEFKKLTDIEKLKVKFVKSIGGSEAEAEAILLARIMAATDDDWKAVMEIRQRRFPE